MSDSRELLRPQQLLALVRELRQVEGAEPVGPEHPFEIVEAIEVHEREHSSPSILGG